MDVYVLLTKANPINPVIAVADSIELLNELMADFPASMQAQMHIWNGDLMTRDD